MLSTQTLYMPNTVHSATRPPGRRSGWPTSWSAASTCPSATGCWSAWSPPPGSPGTCSGTSRRTAMPFQLLPNAVASLPERPAGARRVHRGLGGLGARRRSPVSARGRHHRRRDNFDQWAGRLLMARQDPAEPDIVIEGAGREPAGRAVGGVLRRGRRRAADRDHRRDLDHLRDHRQHRGADRLPGRRRDPVHVHGRLRGDEPAHRQLRRVLLLHQPWAGPGRSASARRSSRCRPTR